MFLIFDQQCNQSFAVARPANSILPRRFAYSNGQAALFPRTRRLASVRSAQLGWADEPKSSGLKGAEIRSVALGIYYTGYNGEEIQMSRKLIGAAFSMLMVGGVAAGETFFALIGEVTDGQITFLHRNKGERKPEKKTLVFADKVVVSQLRGNEEETILKSEWQKRVAKAAKRGLSKGTMAHLTTDDEGRVVGVKLAESHMPATVRDILKKAKEIELYSLEPEEGAVPVKGAMFHGVPVLGKTVVKEDKMRTDVLDILDEAMVPSKMAKCFEPRHGIRATHEGKTVDLVICFACGQVQIHGENEKENNDTKPINRDYQPALDAILQAGKVPLAKGKK